MVSPVLAHQCARTRSARQPPCAFRLLIRMGLGVMTLRKIRRACYALALGAAPVALFVLEAASPKAY